MTKLEFYNCWKDFDWFYILPSICIDRYHECICLSWLCFELDIGLRRR